MKIAFKNDTTLTVVTEYDEEADNIVDEVQEFFEAGEVFEATLIPTDMKEYVDIQFGDGSLALGVNLKSFAEVA